ncbi:deoxynucleoside kinase [Lactobacillus sp. Sy-1]|uniref:deoxynucleoside kinase n=1 Tax=Lactobacillus sp. Sy-1 TaxID=2109645 RepID=UPI001C5ABECA|nr:deoxynucleoside kinase [Lactobacillus sp. Sy-1]MBW1605744.1 deoxynucleoside kinase [Lactobacillus sp. Sy-1]
MIGVGKTTLTGKIAKHFNSRPYYEPVGDNPVLPLYYSDPKRYGFLLQIFFLNKRFKMIKRALKSNHNVLDRSIYEDNLFTRQNNIDGNISDTELAIYTELFNNMRSDLNSIPRSHPDLMVYVYADFETILKRIKKRGRDYEQFDNDPALKDYYYRLWQAYQQWFADYDDSPKIKLDLQKYDLSAHQNLPIVLAQIDEAVNKYNV